MNYGVTIGRLVALASVLSLAMTASAYPVRQPVSLQEMAEMADLIVKAKVISSEPAEDTWFKPTQGFTVNATQLQIISVFKGEPGGKTISFRHYLEAPSGGREFMPQHYKLTTGRSYVVFASKTDTPEVFRQLWANHTSKEDQGVLLAADDQPCTKISVRDVCWLELTGLLASRDADDVVYAVRQLNEMSGGDWMELKDFSREEVAEVIRPLLAAKDEKIAIAAIGAAGSRNPYISSEHALFWLATVGKGHLPGFSKGDAQFDNLAGRLLWRDLAKVADSGAPAKLRALAVRALGRSGVNELPAALDRWAGDNEPLVRQAAVVLLADVPGESANRRIQAAVGDASVEVRQGAAQAIGFAQLVPLVQLLGNLLKDNVPAVREAAAMSLLSFNVADSGDLLRANIKDPEYRALFVNALAADDPTPYLTDLQEIITKRLEPARFWGGFIPAGDSWNILFKYVQSRPAEDLKSGKLDAALDALEKMQWYSSSEPRDLYALYLQRGLVERAKTFRDQCRKQVTYDIDYYFDMVDTTPGLYTRE